MMCISLIGPFSAYVSYEQEVSPKTALTVANKFLDNYSTYESQWKDSFAREPILFSTPDGKPGVYVADVVRAGENVGFIAIGATSERSPIVKLSTGQHPYKNLEAVKSKALDKADKSLNLGNPELIYGGPLMLAAKIPILDQDKPTGNLIYNLQGLFQTKETSVPSLSSKQKENNKKTWDLLLRFGDESTNITPMSSGEYENLSVRNYDQDDSMSPSTGCGPAAGAMVLNYWDECGYDDLQSDSDHYYGK